jgi:hypothetical protein
VKFSVPKVKAVDTSIANFVSRMEARDRQRWQALRNAVVRTYEDRIAQGLTGDSVHIGIEMLKPVELGSEDEDGEEGLGGEASPRRSSRKSVKAEKARARDGEDKVEENDDGEDEPEREGDDGEGDDGGGNDGDQEPREKLHPGYLPYDASRHFFWAKSVSPATSSVLYWY